MIKKSFTGISFVLTWTSPPAHSPGSSGKKALFIIILSIIAAAKRSKEKVLRSGSVLLNNIPFSIAWLYRSFNPRTTRYFPSCTEVPGTLFKTSPVFLSGERRIDSAEITEATVFVFF
jgi:hypothetical protein